MTEQAGRDRAYQDVLRAIADIIPRDWPEGQPRHRMHEGYESDIRLVDLFCRNRSLFGHSSAYIVRRWEAVHYMEPPYFLFYLPGILLAMLRYPNSPLVRMVFGYRVFNIVGLFTEPEWAAIQSLREYLTRPDVKSQPCDGAKRIDRAGELLIGLLATSGLDVGGEIKWGRLTLTSPNLRPCLQVSLSPHRMAIYRGSHLASFQEKDPFERAHSAFDFIKLVADGTESGPR